MATDVRGHTAPAGSDPFNPQVDEANGLLSVNDWVMATNATDRAAKVTAIAPTTTRPVFIRQQDTNGLYQCDGTNQTLIGPAGGAAVRRLMGATNTFNNPTSFTALPVSADATAATITYTKKSADTRLLIRVRLTCELSSGAAQLLTVGASVNGTTYTVGSTWFVVAVSRAVVDGEASVSGIAAGTVTIAPMLMAGAAAINLYAGADSVNVSVVEVP